MTQYTFKEFQTDFPDDLACLTALMKARHGGTRLVCPGCGKDALFHAMNKLIEKSIEGDGSAT